MEISRRTVQEAIGTALERSTVVLLTGPRQSGKTTLAREFLAEDSPNYFDLEDPAAAARLQEPRTALDPLAGLIVIDEVQRNPALFPVLRVLADRRKNRAQFLLLGSASGDLMKQSSESLAGRSEVVRISGFTLEEVGSRHASALWRRGGFPRAYLANSERDSLVWRKEFIQTLLERDLPQWGRRVSPTALLRFWTMVAHYHAQIWKSAEPARALGVSEPTVRGYLDLLTDALMIRQLQPWHANLSKRQVKSPKVFVRDSGLLHKLLGIDSEKALLEHPKVGSSWEGFAVEQILATEPHDEAAYWATHQGAEIDLVLRRGGRLFGVECKRADAPRMTPSLGIALDDLKLERVAVVYPGNKRYHLHEKVEVVPLADLATAGALFGA
jgi:predicted AAA+ superfamily ATPase